MRIEDGQHVFRSRPLVGWLKLFLCILAVKVFAMTIWGYRNYFPPNFDDGFLIGRRALFGGVYPLPFYIHIVSAPIGLVLMSFLVASERPTQKLRVIQRNHRRLGKTTAYLVLTLVVPSGLWMAWWAASGTIAMWGLWIQGSLTAGTMLMAIRAAKNHRFDNHRICMNRCFVLMAAPLLLRVLGGASEVAFMTDLGNQHVALWDNIYRFNTWISWLFPLVAYEVLSSSKTGFRQRINRSVRRTTPRVTTETSF
ncbi:MAG: DUF2306 domain-containing protein [Planctomycetota bacterium]